MTESLSDIVPILVGRPPFSTIEMKLFLLTLKNINYHESENEPFQDLNLSTIEVNNIFGNGAYLSILEEICTEFAEQIITIRDKNGRPDTYPILAHIKYRPEKGLQIKFNEELRPIILDIHESVRGYTKLDAKQLFGLHSAYSIRLLELMIQYRGTMKNEVIKRYIDNDDLIFFLNVDANKYMGSFFQTLIDASINDINQNTEYHMSYEAKRNERKIIGFTFTLEHNNKNDK